MRINIRLLDFIGQVGTISSPPYIPIYLNHTHFPIAIASNRTQDDIRSANDYWRLTIKYTSLTA